MQKLKCGHSVFSRDILLRCNSCAAIDAATNELISRLKKTDSDYSADISHDERKENKRLDQERQDDWESVGGNFKIEEY